MRNLQIAAAMLLPLALTGCWKNQQAAMNVCQAQIPYRGRHPPVTNEITPIVRCMDRAGYERDYDNSNCRIQPVPRRSEYCYRPKGFFATLGYRFEMFVIQPRPKAPVANIVGG